MQPFDNLLASFDSDGMSCGDRWPAFDMAKQHKWIDFDWAESSPPAPPSIEIREYLHYARCKPALILFFL